MIFTWVKYGKPDVSMCLNASLAGLVGITAPCDVTGLLRRYYGWYRFRFPRMLRVWFLDYKLHVDDPVGAVAVHMMNGIWGTIAVGLFATKSAPGYAVQLECGGIKAEGLFYGGGFEQLGRQLLGFAVIATFTAILNNHQYSLQSRRLSVSALPSRKRSSVWISPSTVLFPLMQTSLPLLQISACMATQRTTLRA